jgi:sirohydrochlorin cobaltochelatase
VNALLIIAHGSRSKGSNDEVCRLAHCIGENPGAAFSITAYAFLELASPRVDSAIARLAEQGAVEIKVFPYLLGGGVHVANDIPRVIEEAKRTHPNVHFEILPHLGALEGVSSLILKHINAFTQPD